MPSHNGFHGHVAWADRHSKIPFRSNNYIREHKKEVSKDGKTITCYVAAETGRYFTGTWWCNDRNPSTAQPYTAEFICDGESVQLAKFDAKAAATIQGIAEDNTRGAHYFMFRSMDISGEGDSSTPIPDEIGKLEIVIRELASDDEVDSGDSSSDESDGESDSEDSSASGDCDDSEDETYQGKTGKVRSKTRPQGKSNSPKKLHDIFPNWSEKKPRHTHTAVKTRSDGKLWQDRARCHVPELFKFPDSNEGDLIVKFVFIYTSKEYIRTLMNTKTEPRASLSSSPQRQLSDPNNEGQPARKRRRTEPARPIKTEDEQGMYDEMLDLQERADRLRRALENSKRARGDAVEGDRGNPINVVEDD